MARQMKKTASAGEDCPTMTESTRLTEASTMAMKTCRP